VEGRKREGWEKEREGPRRVECSCDRYRPTPISTKECVRVCMEYGPLYIK
jgi:hypothetical protein